MISASPSHGNQPRLLGSAWTDFEAGVGSFFAQGGESGGADTIQPDCGTGAASTGVAALQAAMRQMSAFVSGTDPGRYDGCFDNASLNAMVAGLQVLPGLSKTIKTAIQLAASILPMVETSTAFKAIAQTAKDMIASNAPMITGLINAYLSTKGATPGAGSTPPPSTQLLTPTTMPAGSITAYSPSRGVWRAAVPKSTLGVADGGGRCLYGACFGDGYTEVAGLTQAQKDQLTSIITTTEADFEKKVGASGPFYATWWFWTAVGGGVLVLGTGTYLLLRKSPSKPVAGARWGRRH